MSVVFRRMQKITLFYMLTSEYLRRYTKIHSMAEYPLCFINKICNDERQKKIGVESQSPLLLVDVESHGSISVYGSSQPNPMIYEVKSHPPPPPSQPETKYRKPSRFQDYRPWQAMRVSQRTFITVHIN